MVAQAISYVFGVAEFLTANIIARVFFRIGEKEIHAYIQSLPQVYFAHKGSIIFVATSENRKEHGSVMFVPVRHIH